jgi:hypothetical protein
MKKSSQIAWKIVPLRHFFPLIEVLLYCEAAGQDLHILKNPKP